MKRSIFLILAMAIMALVLPSAKEPDVLKFAETTFDFGNITDKHEPVVHEFAFTNVSDEPVAILSVSTGCGCTRPTYPTEPVKAGKTAKIKITFLPAGQSGEINKDVKVRYRSATARSSKRITLRIRGHVTPQK